MGENNLKRIYVARVKPDQAYPQILLVTRLLLRGARSKGFATWNDQVLKTCGVLVAATMYVFDFELGLIWFDSDCSRKLLCIKPCFRERKLNKWTNYFLLVKYFHFEFFLRKDRLLSVECLFLVPLKPSLVLLFLQQCAACAAGPMLIDNG